MSCDLEVTKPMRTHTVGKKNPAILHRVLCVMEHLILSFQCRILNNVNWKIVAEHHHPHTVDSPSVVSTNYLSRSVVSSRFILGIGQPEPQSLGLRHAVYMLRMSWVWSLLCKISDF